MKREEVDYEEEEITLDAERAEGERKTTRDK